MRSGAVLGVLLAVVPFDSDRPGQGDGRHQPDERRARRSTPTRWSPSIWATKVVPYFEKKAGPFVEVRDLAAKAPDEAGAKYGYRAKSDGTPWTLMVKIEGTIVAADTESRAATLGVDATGQGRTEVTVQIGPAMRGTAIRDALDFVSFNDFTNQIDFARFGKAFNTYVKQHARDAAARGPRSAARFADRRLRARRAASRRW